MNRKFISSILVIVLLFVAYGIYVQLSRIGKVRVDVETIPVSSLVTVDGEILTGKSVYLAPGEHMFIASKDGYLESRSKLDVSETNNYVGLLPIAESESAIQSSVNDAAAREAVGGKIATARGNMLREKATIISKLPRITLVGPYRIDYGIQGKDNTSHPYLLISNSTPKGRQNALDWIRSEGSEPTDLDIRFPDFINPVTGGSIDE